MNWRSGFGFIPGPAKIVAALAFVVFFFGVIEEHRASGLATLIGLAGGTLAGAYFLLAGYVYVDAVRRSMPSIPWTALAVLIPNCVGFVLYGSGVESPAGAGGYRSRPAVSRIGSVLE